MLKGVYHGSESFALGLIPVSKHMGFCGDASITKSPVQEIWEDGWAIYEDVPEEFLGSILMGEVLERMRDS